MAALFVSSMAQALRDLPPDEVVEQLDQLPADMAEKIRQHMQFDRSPGSLLGTPLTRFWWRYWKDIKLQALAHRFYQHAVWTVTEADLYTITRHGPALYRVAGFTEKGVLMEHLCNDDGTIDPTQLAQEPMEWDADEFKHGGFAVNRVHIPVWLWKVVAEEHGVELSDTDLGLPFEAA